MTSLAREHGRLDLPGHNLPLNWTPNEKYNTSLSVDDSAKKFDVLAQGAGRNMLPTALDDAHIDGEKCTLPLTTLREFTMMHVMNSITDKLGWEEKVFDGATTDRWKLEAMETDGQDVTKKMMDWVIDELRHKTKIFKMTGAVSVYNGDVVKSDIAIPADLKASLRTSVHSLENISQVYKDYHPGSDGKVLDLVHPSLFPLIYGRSRIIADRLIDIHECVRLIGTGSTIQIRPVEETVLDRKGEPASGYGQVQPSRPYSRNFQWLPCEVDISDGTAKITSYINNLHPQQHEDLYSVIEKIISKAIPLWNMTLTPLSDKEYFKRIVFELEFDPDPDKMDEEDKPQIGEDENEDEYYDRLQQWEDNVRKVVQPEPGEFPEQNDDLHNPDGEEKAPESSGFKYDLVRDFGTRGLQVIVKLANIELTPDRPEYEGGTWHVEGQLNEHICATALYYYDNLNITESHLAFRQQVSAEEVNDLMYPQNVHGWLTDIYGCEQNGPTVQEVGSILCKEDRLVTFPNILQHRVQSFKLSDTTRPGHRKILALFLVDPGIRIISTANVPPQQRDWWSEYVSMMFSETRDTFGKLSSELKKQVYEEVDTFPIGIDDAKEIRLRLMAERSVAVIEQTQNFQKNEFNLCEH